MATQVQSLGQAFLPRNKGQDKRKWHQGRFRLEIGGNVFTGSPGLVSRAAVGSWGSDRCRDVAPGDRVGGGLAVLGLCFKPAVVPLL